MNDDTQLDSAPSAFIDPATALKDEIERSVAVAEEFLSLYPRWKHTKQDVEYLAYKIRSFR